MNDWLNICNVCTLCMYFWVYMFVCLCICMSVSVCKYGCMYACLYLCACVYLYIAWSVYVAITHNHRCRAVFAMASKVCIMTTFCQVYICLWMFLFVECVWLIRSEDRLREHIDPNSYSWCLMRYAVIKFIGQSLRSFLPKIGMDLAGARGLWRANQNVFYRGRVWECDVVKDVAWSCFFQAGFRRSWVEFSP